MEGPTPAGARMLVTRLDWGDRIQTESNRALAAARVAPSVADVVSPDADQPPHE